MRERISAGARRNRSAFRLTTVVIALAASATLCAGALAQDSALVVREAWARATPGGAKVGAGYFVIENRGSAPQQLVGGEAEVSTKVEVHETTETGGVSRMRQVERLTVEPGQSVTFAPSGYHLMLTGLKRPLKQGERFRATLVFEPGGRVSAQFDVRALGAGASGAAHHQH